MIFHPFSSQFSVQENPWQLPLIIDTQEAIGRAIWLQGVYDPIVTEVLWRLTQLGDFVIDVGANFGYTASIFSARAGGQGRVYAFEPHPLVYDLLRQNASEWGRLGDAAKVFISPTGISDRDGDASLHLNADFAMNRGGSSIQEDRREPGGETLLIKINRLESVIPRTNPIAVMKVDVEGHELKVFSGMGALLHLKLVRDIVFEEKSPYPAQTHRFLEAAGYTLFGLDSTFWGVRLVPPDSPNHQKYFEPNFIATLDQKWVEKTFHSKGWKSLKG